MRLNKKKKLKLEALVGEGDLNSRPPRDMNLKVGTADRGVHFFFFFFFFFTHLYPFQIEVFFSRSDAISFSSKKLNM